MKVEIQDAGWVRLCLRQAIAQQLFGQAMGNIADVSVLGSFGIWRFRIAMGSFGALRKLYFFAVGLFELQNIVTTNVRLRCACGYLPVNR